MRRRGVTLALVIALGIAAAAALSAAAPNRASAHASDCHATRSCPSDEHSYIWQDSSGQGWDCALSESGAPEEGAVAISYDGFTYSCWAVAPPTDTTTTEAGTTAPPPTATTAPPPPAPQPSAREQLGRVTKTEARPRPQPRPSGTTQRSRPGFPVQSVPPIRSPKLTAGGYVFPIYGPSSYTDTFGAPRADTAWHHGDDIFAPLGAPILAVADGTVFSVGWNDIGGNRLWLEDRQGNQFYYAHLSAFSPLAVDGAFVRAGTVLGFVGNTGDAVGTPYHLHFEIHPVSRLSLGYDGVVNPTAYLDAWRRLQDVRFSAADVRLAAASGWTLPLVTAARAPKPGAVLLERYDISSASGLDKGSLVRAYAAPQRAESVTVLEPDFEQLHGFPRPPLPGGSGEIGGDPEQWQHDVGSTLVWDALAQCESGGDWQANTGNSFFGGVQFLLSTWIRNGGAAYAKRPDLATREEQIVIAERTLANEGWDSWPACSKKLGLR